MQPSVFWREIIYLLTSGVWPYQNYCVVFVACLFSLTSLGAYYILLFPDPFSESNRSDWEPFWDPFSADKFEFSKSIGEFTTDWFKSSESVGEVAVDQSKFIFYESTVNIEAVDWSFVSKKGGRTIVWCCTYSRYFIFACWTRFWRIQSLESVSE